MSSHEPKLSVIFPVGIIGLVIVIGSYLFSIFMTNLGSEDYTKYGQYYADLTVFGLMIFAITIIITFQRDPVPISYLDEKKTTADFAALAVAMFGGLAGLAILKQTFAYSVVLVIPLWVIQLHLVASEEMAFRVALPRLFYLLFFNLNDTLRWFLSSLISAMLFGMFHFYAYGADATNMMMAVIAGILQSWIYKVASNLGGGEMALVGLIGGHFVWNMYALGSDAIEAALVYFLFMSTLMVIRGYRARVEDLRRINLSRSLSRIFRI